MSGWLAVAALACSAMSLAACACALRLAAVAARQAGRVRELAALSPHARLLGRVVEARKYEASGWERYIVVAVSWHGSVCLREEARPEETGFWLRRPGPDRMREVA